MNKLEYQEKRSALRKILRSIAVDRCTTEIRDNFVASRRHGRDITKFVLFDADTQLTLATFHMGNRTTVRCAPNSIFVEDIKNFGYPIKPVVFVEGRNMSEVNEWAQENLGLHYMRLNRLDPILFMRERRRNARRRRRFVRSRTRQEPIRETNTTDHFRIGYEVDMHEGMSHLDAWMRSIGINTNDPIHNQTLQMWVNSSRDPMLRDDSNTFTIHINMQDVINERRQRELLETVNHMQDIRESYPTIGFPIQTATEMWFSDAQEETPVNPFDLTIEDRN